MLGTAGCRLLTCHWDHRAHGSFLLTFWLAQMWGPDSSKPTSVFSKECVNNNYQGAVFFFLEGLWGHFSACLQNIEKCRWLLRPWLQLPWRLVELASVLPEFWLFSSSSDLIEAFCSSNNFFLFCLVYSFVWSELVKSLISGTWT